MSRWAGWRVDRIPAGAAAVVAHRSRRHVPPRRPRRRHVCPRARRATGTRPSRARSRGIGTARRRDHPEERRRRDNPGRGCRRGSGPRGPRGPLPRRVARSGAPPLAVDARERERSIHEPRPLGGLPSGGPGPLQASESGRTCACRTLEPPRRRRTTVRCGRRPRCRPRHRGQASAGREGVVDPRGREQRPGPRAGRRRRQLRDPAPADREHPAAGGPGGGDSDRTSLDGADMDRGVDPRRQGHPHDRPRARARRRRRELAREPVPFAGSRCRRACSTNRRRREPAWRSRR